MCFLPKALAPLALAALFAVAGVAGAQTLDMQETQPSMTGERPTRGMTQARVEAKYGEPVRRIAAVGEPPIARWEYPEMIVYFEHDRVIHAVVKR